MENASKALLIAGAVLIAIVLISLGVILISKSGDTSDKAGATSNYMQDSANKAVNKIKSTTIPGI